jgi:DNA-directed RNA polymerase subunit RPC12/RpoP
MLIMPFMHYTTVFRCQDCGAVGTYPGLAEEIEQRQGAMYCFKCGARMEAVKTMNNWKAASIIAVLLAAVYLAYFLIKQRSILLWTLSAASVAVLLIVVVIGRRIRYSQLLKAKSINEIVGSLKQTRCARCGGAVAPGKAGLGAGGGRMSYLAARYLNLWPKTWVFTVDHECCLCHTHGSLAFDVTLCPELTHSNTMLEAVTRFMGTWIRTTRDMEAPKDAS